jgi:hypothetical protein
MTTKLRAHLVWAHPRENSLTSALVRAVHDSLAERGCDVDELDLYRSGFDPVLHEPDEPDWDDPTKSYSSVVEELANRAQRANVIVVVFPLWWYALPAVLKGYLDRVWNFGRLYGDNSGAKPSAVVWVALAGLSREALDKRGHVDALARQLDDGVAGYCEIGDSRTVVLCDTIDGPDLVAYLNQVNQQLDEVVRDSLDQ